MVCSGPVMRVLRLRATAVRATHLRRRQGRSLRTVWRPVRRRGLGFFVRRLFSFARLSYSSPPRLATPVVVAAATEATPNEKTFSELSNGPPPENLVLHEVLGTGTFGVVHRGIDGDSQTEVAVKLVSKKRQGNDPASIKLVKHRIEHEVAMWCELQNFASAVRLMKFYEDDERVYFVQELCTGGTVEQLMKVRGCLSEVEAAHIMKTVFSLCAFCHDRNIAYCDIKPANFILPSPIIGWNGLHSPTDFVKVIDFGSAESVPQSGLRGEKGTPLYQAPEVLHSRYNVESDMWSAGVMLYYLLSGEHPFIGSTKKALSPSALSFYLQHGELKFDASVWQHVSADAKHLIQSLLNRSVKSRLTSREALSHPWVRHLATSDWPMDTPTYSDICPMNASLNVLDPIHDD